MMRLHANAIPKNRAASVGTRRIYGDDPDRLLLLAILARELINQRALAGAWRTGESDHGRVATVGEERLHQANRLRGVIFNCANGASESTNIAAANTFDKRFQR